MAKRKLDQEPKRQVSPTEQSFRSLQAKFTSEDPAIKATVSKAEIDAAAVAVLEEQMKGFPLGSKERHDLLVKIQFIRHF